MVRFLKHLLNGEKGQALPIVLAVLAIGGLTIVPGLNYATTVLNTSRMLDERMNGIYAAGAGVEHCLWCINNGSPATSNLTENINQMSVNMTTVNQGTYTFYLGGLAMPGAKSDRLSINSTVTWDSGNRYRYVISIIRTAEPGAGTIHIQEVGARIPVGYTYDDSASRSDGGPLLDNKPPGDNNPVMTQDAAGAYLLRWVWTASRRPVIEDTGGAFTFTFYITGTGSLDGEYCWTVCDPTAYGLCGEITGTWYQITAQARRPVDNRTTARIVTDIVKQTGGAIHILSWRIIL